MPQSKEQRAAYIKEYREKNKEQIAAYMKDYYNNNKEGMNAKKRKWRIENKEVISIYNKEYVENNKEAVSTYKKECYKENKERATAQQRNRRYGLLPKDYNTMLEEQDNKCKICLGEFNDQTVTNIDHCHTTNKVRGILCPHCNRGLGQFKEDIEVLTKAINYLQENK